MENLAAYSTEPGPMMEMLKSFQRRGYTITWRWSVEGHRVGIGIEVFHYVALADTMELAACRAAFKAQVGESARARYVKPKAGY